MVFIFILQMTPSFLIILYSHYLFQLTFSKLHKSILRVRGQKANIWACNCCPWAWDKTILKGIFPSYLMAKCHIFGIYKGHFISTQDVKQYCLDSFCKHNFCQMCKPRPLLKSAELRFHLFLPTIQVFSSDAKGSCWVPEFNGLALKLMACSKY